MFFEEEPFCKIKKPVPKKKRAFIFILSVTPATPLSPSTGSGQALYFKDRRLCAVRLPGLCPFDDL
jgi:hypothetical protein